MAEHKEITTKQLLDAETIAVSGSTTSDPIDLGQYAQNGYFSLQLDVSGSGGTVTVTYELSNNASDFMTPVSAANIVTGFSGTSGAGADGKDLITFTPEIAAQLKIVTTNAGSSDTTTVSSWLAMQ